MAVYGTPTGNSSNLLLNVIHSSDKARGLGANNRSLYSNPSVDKLIDDSQTIFDTDEANRKLLEATKAGLQDSAILPLFFLKSSWGTKKGISLESRDLGLGH
jgi:peptide/nickel transport system substrate-binding protein